MFHFATHTVLHTLESSQKIRNWDVMIRISSWQEGTVRGKGGGGGKCSFSHGTGWNDFGGWGLELFEVPQFVEKSLTFLVNVIARKQG